MCMYYIYIILSQNFDCDSRNLVMNKNVTIAVRGEVDILLLLVQILSLFFEVR